MRDPGMIPRAANLSDEEIRACTAEELIDLLLELRQEYRVVSKARVEHSLENAKLVRRLHDIKKAVETVDV